jgi:hypothetical protein
VDSYQHLWSSSDGVSRLRAWFCCESWIQTVLHISTAFSKTDATADAQGQVQNSEYSSQALLSYQPAAALA